MSSDTPFLSIIIPTLNEERALNRTLEKLSQLKTIPFELIISDGKSTDNTLKIAKAYTEQVVVYQGATRQTIANARNLGAQGAKGEFLVFLDADVIVSHPDRFFSGLIKEFKRDAKLFGATVNIRVDKAYETFNDRWFFALMDFTTRVRNNILHIGGASGEFQMIRRSAFIQVNGYNDLLVAYEDFDLFERLSRNGRTRLFPAFTVHHTGRRVHKVGHIKLLLTWMINGIWFMTFRKSHSKEWKPIR